MTSQHSHRAEEYEDVIATTRKAFIMLEVRCSGTPHEVRWLADITLSLSCSRLITWQVGVAHGSQAQAQIRGSIAFYSGLFRESCAMSWPAVVEEAGRYVNSLEQVAPRYLEEIRGIAEGAGLPFLDVLALNIRTEINFGLFTDAAKKMDTPSDGCTSLSWQTAKASWLCQNVSNAACPSLQCSRGIFPVVFLSPFVPFILA